MIDQIIVMLSYFLMLLGTFFIFTAAIGCLKFPNLFTRLHAAGVGEACGAPLVLLGASIYHGLTIASFKLLLLTAFIAFSSSTSSHSLALAAVSGVKNLQNKKEEEDI